MCARNHMLLLLLLLLLLQLLFLPPRQDLPLLLLLLSCARVRVRGDAKGRAWGGLGSGVGHAGLQETWKEALHLVFNKSGFKPAIFTSHSKASAPAGCQAAAA